MSSFIPVVAEQELVIVVTEVTTARRVRLISRVTSPDVIQQSSLNDLQRSLAEFGEAELAEMRTDGQYRFDGGAGTQTAGDVATVEAHRNAMFDSLVDQFSTELTPISLTVSPGTQIVPAPYDNSWQTGTGFPFSKLDGKMGIIGSSGFSGSGFSFFLSSSQSVSATIIPGGTYKHSFTSFQPLPQLRTKGGVGVIVYENRNKIKDITATLWNRIGILPFASENVELAMADVAGMSAGPFPPARIFPLEFTMSPGANYEIWLYLWHAGTNVDGTSFLGTVSGSVPLVTVVAGPPVIVH
ncbi:hypothetical protein [Micromonospora sp. CB01531]|uniref:hypothetical protein n=1 Tax=Micromonospora sp. CB01531 TaxID=1718947 RepID=UPI00093E188B|nr:hypothetical protein [Micromonospora sp. CB01531]OKI86613.1 hypothetical protein A6A27_39885 [Micromonospora sp. CB01531]